MVHGTNPGDLFCPLTVTQFSMLFPKLLIAFVRISDHKITFYLYKILISFSFIFQITATNLHKFRYTLRGGRCTLLNVCPLLGYLIKSETSNLQLFIVVNVVATNKPYTIVRAIVQRAN